MLVSRSAFLKACATVFVGIGARSPVGELVLQASCAPSASEATAAAAGRFAWATASAAVFRPHVGSAFRVRHADGAATALELARVIEAPRHPGIEQFSLVFHAPACAAIDGVRTLAHATLGDVDLFIAPVGAPRGRVRDYEACISRLVAGGPAHE